jgi:hypothetical protein
MRRLTLAFVMMGLFLAIAEEHRALAGSGGSSYSMFGIGDIRYPIGVRGAGMGYTGIGLPASSYINSLAPATWSRIDRVRFEGSLMVEGFNSTDGDRSRFLARGDFTGLILGLPVSRQYGITFVGGFVPYSTFNYDAYANGSYTGTVDTMKYTIHHIGTGGITRGFLGFSYTPAADLAVGFSLNYLFGSLTDSQEQVPLTPNTYGGTVYSNSTGNGVSFTLGGLWSGAGEFVPALKPLNIGFTFTTRANLNATGQRDYKYAPDLYTTQRDTTPEFSSATSIPLSWGIGVSYQASERVVLAADYFTQAWSSAELWGESPRSIRDSYRMGIGAEVAPSRELYARWFTRLAYRLGAYYNATYVEADGTPINEWGITAGLSIPFSGDSRLNFQGEYARRGTTDNGLIKDQIWRLSVSLNISASWFQQFGED